MKKLVLLFAVIFTLTATLSGCASYSINTSQKDIPDLSPIAPRADGGPAIQVYASGGLAPTNFGESAGISKHIESALVGSGYFSDINVLADWVDDPSKIEGIYLQVTTSRDKDFNPVTFINVIFSMFTLYIVPQHLSGDITATIKVYDNGELLSTWTMENKFVQFDGTLPIVYLFGQSGEVTGEAYAAILATNAINEMHKLNLL